MCVCVCVPQKGDLKAIAAKWKSLSDEKKEEYNEKAKLTVRPDKK